MSVIRLKYFYKAYHLDREGGIRNLELIEAMNDQDALDQVGERGFDHEIELWDRTRLIGRVEPSVRPSSAGMIGAGVMAVGRPVDTIVPRSEVA